MKTLEQRFALTHGTAVCGPARTVGVGAAVSNGRGYPIFPHYVATKFTDEMTGDSVTNRNGP